jgi:hypothetical protein
MENFVLSCGVGQFSNSVWLVDGASMRKFRSLIILGLAACMWSQSPQAHTSAAPEKQAFGGAWWAGADSEEKAGFLNGAADCMTWDAHKAGFNATPGQLIDRITNFYRTHPESADLTVIDVWQRVENRSKPIKDKSPSAETWKNAHWYLNGDWWMQTSKRQQFGFVEGYLWCLRTQTQTSAESYSQSAISYQRKIDAFVRANPKLGNEAIATTLRRFRDRVQTAGPR